MPMSSAFPVAGGLPSPDAGSAPRLRVFILAHVGWIIAAVLDVVVFVVGVPLYYKLLHIPCGSPAAQGSCTAGQLSPKQFAAASRLPVLIDTYAAFALAVVVATSIVFFAIGALIAWRKWQDGMGLFVSLVLITFGATGISDSLLSAVGLAVVNTAPGWRLIFTVLADMLIFGQWPAFGAFLLTFPTGRFAPRWSWLLVGVWALNDLTFSIHAPPLISTATILATIGGALAVQIYRYRSVYDTVQRHQTKWLVFSIAAAVVLVSLSTAGQTIPAALGVHASPYQATSLLRSAAFFLPVALAVGVAVLRYRLYDIDVFINRALVYGALTALLAAFYFGAVIAFQIISQALTGQREQPAGIVLSTLLTAALFQPLRRRLQTNIDRRFFRRKYDAARTVAAFGASLRSEVDLTRLADDLLSVVDETMQPEHISLWLAQPQTPVSNNDADARPEADASATSSNLAYPPLRVS